MQNHAESTNKPNICVCSQMVPDDDTEIVIVPVVSPMELTEKLPVETVSVEKHSTLSKTTPPSSVQDRSDFPSMKRYQLVIDARERMVIRHRDEFSFPVQIKTITTGDFAIVETVDGQDHIKVIIERKTLEDYAASMKDGRSENKQKLLRMREETGCRILFIIEGNLSPPLDSQFGRINYSSIESSIFHLMLEHNILVIKTTDTLDTAKTLNRLIISADNLGRGRMIGGGAVNDIDATNGAASGHNTTTLLTASHPKTQLEIVRAMWACFPGISESSADDFVRRWKLADIICEKIDRNVIASARNASARLYPKKVTGALQAVPLTVEVALLASVPGISKATAQSLLGSVRLRDLLIMTPADMAALPVGKKTIGTARAAKIHECFYFIKE